VNVAVQFTKSADEPEKRVVIRVDLHDADTNQKVSGGIQDNGATGFTGDSGAVVCSVPVPANASGAYYFKAWVSPWSLNRAIVAQYKSYPTNGTFTYDWNSSRPGDYGVTQDVMYRGVNVAPDYPGNTTYCSGVAFETCIVALNKYNSQYGHPYIGNIVTGTQMVEFRRIWYGNVNPGGPELKLAAEAIPIWGVGIEVSNLEEAQEGDFVQLWRNTVSLSGHNPLFVSWKRDSSGPITGVNYWGSQGGSNGIGYRSENFGTTSGVDATRFYIGRVRKPRDQADYDWALGVADTTPNLSVVPSAVNDWMSYQE
jgi:hypothetical protein